MAPTLGEKVADQTEMVGEQLLIDFGNVPARQEGMQAIHEGSIVAHFRRHRSKQVSDPLLMFDVDIKVADEHDAPIGADTFLPRLNSPDSI